MCEYHGSLARWRCDESNVELEPPAIDQDPAPPSHCGQRMRPSAVLFGEAIPTGAERAAKVALRDCDLFVAINNRHVGDGGTRVELRAVGRAQRGPPRVASRQPQRTRSRLPTRSTQLR